MRYILASSSQPDNSKETNPDLFKRIRYCGDKAIDDRADTVWAEGATGPGIGESVTAKLEHWIAVNGIEILSGYGDARYFKSNNGIRRFMLETGDGT